MSQDQDQQTDVLMFPNQISYEASEELEENLINLRLRLTQCVNRLNAGQQEMTDDLKDWITKVNGIMADAGYEPVPYNFN
jgi:hypothetical protein